MTNLTGPARALPYYKLHAKLRVACAKAEHECRESMTRRADPVTIAQNFGAWISLCEFRDEIFVEWPVDPSE